LDDDRSHVRVAATPVSARRLTLLMRATSIITCIETQYHPHHVPSKVPS